LIVGWVVWKDCCSVEGTIWFREVQLQKRSKQAKKVRK
jgi:hypothetical protein